jgi:hypothetical protein
LALAERSVSSLGRQKKGKVVTSLVFTLTAGTLWLDC